MPDSKHPMAPLPRRWTWLSMFGAASREPTTALDTRPPEQLAFSELIQQYRDAYGAADNELKRSAVRWERAQGLRRMFRTRNFSDWEGRITLLGTTWAGMARVTIDIGNGIVLRTMSNTLADIVARTLMRPGTRVFTELSQKGPGEVVRFSGTLVRGGSDFIRELSIGEAGSMRNPAFVVRLSGVK
jgi:hypothetical protein